MIDHDDELTTETEEAFDGESFAEMFEKSQKEKGNRLTPGQKVTAKILKISSEWVFIDSGHKGEGVIDRKEFQDLDGNLTVAEGDNVSAFFTSSRHGEMRFTTKVGGGAGGSSQLEEAFQSGLPVEGVIEKEIKGGYEVRLAGTTRAFCPFSQVSLRRVDDPASLVGSRLTFRITAYGERGRNIVVSRRVLLEEEQQRMKEEARASISEGQVVTGTVTSLRDFGAFVDIGGLEGLIPMAELGWTRVKSASDVLSVGQQVRVAVKAIDHERDRISLSLKDTQTDPWEQAAQRFPEGSFHNGTITRLAQFGAFVALGDGIEGLIHISKLGGGKRINHPREAVQEGDSLEVKIEAVDRAAQRISLSLAGIARAADEEQATLDAFRQQATSSVQGMGTLADLFNSAKKSNRK